MTIAFVQQTITPDTSGSSRASATQPVTKKTSVGNTVVLSVRANSGVAISSVTDSQGNSYTIINAGATASTSALAIGYQAKSLDPAVGDSITVTPASSVGFQWCADEYSGITQTNPITAQAVNSAKSTSLSASVTPVNATDQLFAAFGATAGTVGGPAGFTERDVASPSSGASAALFDDLSNNSTSPQSLTFTASASGNLSLVLVTVAAAAAGSTTYTDSPSGTSTTSGTLTETSTHASTPAGTSATGGSRTEASSHQSTPAGTSVTSGTRTETSTHAATPTGTSRTTGTRTEAQAHTSSPTGTSTSSGTIVEHYAPPSNAPPVWLPTSVSLKNPQATATMKGKTLTLAMSTGPQPTAAMSPGPQPVAALDPHTTTVTLDG